MILDWLTVMVLELREPRRPLNLKVNDDMQYIVSMN